MISEDELRDFYVGKDIEDVPKPAAVLDRAIVRQHCEKMIQATRALNFGFRAHIKTHKTTQIAEMQVRDSPEANFIVSTLLEAETLVPLVQKLQAENRRVNVLYGIPLVPSQVTRLAHIALRLGKGSISVMIEHPDQVVYLEKFFAVTNFPALVFLKIDTGYHRAGLPPAALNKQNLLEKLANAEQSGHAEFLGVYSHSSLSYSGTTPEEAMTHLMTEIKGCKEALEQHSNLLPSNKELVISVGATPQALSSYNLLGSSSGPEATALRSLFRETSLVGTKLKTRIELHAGVYTLLDMQQFSTKATSLDKFAEREIAMSILAEVCSVYNDGERSKPEALLAAGTLALGREPCPSYSGWGVVSSWRLPNSPTDRRLIVERISQEHSIVSWEGEGQNAQIPLSIGQTVKILPNHACVAGAFYGWYLIVDTDEDPGAARIVDVWVRAKGTDFTPQVLDPRRQ